MITWKARFYTKIKVSKGLFTNRIPIQSLSVLLGLSFLLMFGEGRAWWGTLRQGFHQVQMIVAYGVYFPSKVGHVFWDYAKSHKSIIEENTRLNAENLKLRSIVSRLSLLTKEQKGLRALLQSALPENSGFVVTNVLAVPMMGVRQTVMVDRGKDDFVYVGQPVIDAKGVVGQVVSLTNKTALVMLLTDAKSAIPVETLDGVRAIAVGDGQTPYLYLRHVPDHNHLKVGDQLRSSGLGLVYPPHYPVGRIIQIKRTKQSDFAQIEVAPSARLNKSRLMLLLWLKKTHKHYQKELFRLESELEGEA